MTTFDWQVRVYYEDTDASGVVFHANYLNFLERARTEMLRAKGFEHDGLLKDENIVFVVRSLAIDYLLPAKFNQLLCVKTQINALKKASFAFEQQIYCAEVLLCKATVLIACLEASSFRPTAIPENLRTAFTK